MNRLLSRSLALAIALLAAPSWGQPAPVPTEPAVFDTLAIIAPGKERDILALIEPYRGEREIVEGWRVTAIKIPKDHVRFELAGPGRARAELLLKHPTTSQSPIGTSSFVIETAGDASAKPALEALTESIRARDQGGIWKRRPVSAQWFEGIWKRRPVSAQWFDAVPDSSPNDLLVELARRASWAPVRDPHGPESWRVTRLLRDGVLLSLLALLLVGVHLRRVLRPAPRWVPWGLVGLVLVGAALRYALSPETVMNAWPYTRTPPLVKAIMDGMVMQELSTRFGYVIHLTDAIHLVDFLVAVVTPVVFFAHARFALDGWKPALFAAALLVFLPIHLHFSRSDVEYVQSLATSSLTFVALYTSLRDPSRGWRWFALGLLPLLSLATYAVRPENMVFVAIDVGAILLTAGRDVPRQRRFTVLGVVVAVALYSLVTRLLVGYGHNVSEGLSLTTLASAAALVFDVHRNTLINFSITPVVVTLLAVAGLVHLVRSGQGRRALYLSGWLVSFFIVHSYVVPSEPAMMARYHMHLITPLLLMAASALPLVWGAPRIVGVAVGLAVVMSPAIHHAFITRDDFVIMREYDLIRASRHLVPDGCTVLEFLPADSLTDRRLWAPGDSRLLRHGAVLRNGQPDERWRFINLAMLKEPGDGKDPLHEVLTDEARAVLENPPACLVFLEGMTCRTHRPQGTERAPACDEALALTRAQPLAGATVPLRVYDERNMGRLETPRERVVAGAPINLALHRLWPKESGPAAPSATAGDAP